MLISPLALPSLLFTCLLMAPQESAQDGTAVAEPATAAAPAWFGRLDDARDEAERTGRPILLMSAAPQCSGAPGMW